MLFVDDEPRVLEGLRKVLRAKRNEWDTHFASSGDAGLQLLTEMSCQVVVADMRMPGMNGAAFLAKVRDQWPDTIRMLLTGHADMDTAVAAVNDGYIFRFLRKPCPVPLLIKALEDAVEQYRLVTKDRQLMEEKLEHLSKQLLRADRLASLGTVASGVGHELGNVGQLLAATTAFVRQQAESGEPPDQEDLDALSQVVKHIRVHAKHLLDLGRPGGNDKEEIDFRNLVRSTLDMLRAIGKTKRVEIAADLAATPMPVRANRIRLEQVLVNLITNATHAVSEVPDRPSRIRVIVRIDDAESKVICRVADNGVGIPADELESIFEPYFTTKPPDQGTGLGLPVVKQIMDHHRGTIDVESTVGEGTTFTIQVPVHDPTPHEDADLASAGVVRGSRKGTAANT